MPKKWTVIYYEAADGNCPVEIFLNAISDKSRAKVLAFIGQLQERGPNLPRPYADLLKDGIHELRVKITGSQYRVLYFFCHQDHIILTHALRKDADRVPEGEINAAKAMRTDHLKRHG